MTPAHAMGVVNRFPIALLAAFTIVWLALLAVSSTFALAAMFEIVEWAAVVVGGTAIGPREGGYLGTQGDEFEAVKDMALGLAGAACSIAALAIRHHVGPAAGTEKSPESEA